MLLIQNVLLMFIHLFKYHISSQLYVRLWGRFQEFRCVKRVQNVVSGCEKCSSGWGGGLTGRPAMQTSRCLICS